MEKKPWWQSKTVWGLVLAVAGMLLAQKGIAVPTDDPTVQALVDLVAKGAEVIGAALALYGRVKAAQPLSAK